ncbi:RNA polymerase sigma factor [Haloferula chungangensis]|uniref:RNA polymerase sigma factor n=1 Tax=Haloferula chungangensis TaxID=1048331 RepID=A0ABW2L5U8_9BACT
MENSRTDQQLLRGYLKSGDQRAFRQLAERYSGLIYHTALRVSNNRTLAEDVSQRVLAALAKKAGTILRDGIPLSAWLHRATMLEAKSLGRSEARHHRKKEALMLEPTDHSSPESDASWQEALPHLDAAINTLPETDRRVVLLHYVDGLTFPEIARRLNKSAAAVQKQSRRALERLQSLLGKRGVTLSVGLLALGMTSEMAKAAPLTLITSLGSVQTFSTTTQILAVKKTTIAAVGATILLCGIPLAKQQLSINRLESQLGGIGYDTRQASPRVRPINEAGEKSQLERLAKDLSSNDSNVRRYLAAVDHLESLSDEELILLPQNAHSINLSLELQQTILRMSIHTLGERNRELALDALLHRVPKAMFAGNYDCDGVLTNQIRNFSDSNPSAAYAWFEENLEAIRRLPKHPNMNDDTLENPVRLSLAWGFVFTAPDTAVEILRTVNLGAIQGFLDQLCRSKAPDLRKQPEGVLQIAREFLPPDRALSVIGNAAAPSILTDGKGFTVYRDYDNFLDRQELSESERYFVLTKAGLSAIRSSGERSAEEKILHYRQWLESREIENPDYLVGASMALKLSRYRSGSEIIYPILQNRRSIDFSDEILIGFLENIASERSAQISAQLELLPSAADDPKPVQDLVDQITSKQSR